MEASNIFYGVLWCPMTSLRSSLSILKPRCMEVVGISPILFYMGLLRSPLTSGDFCLFVALCNYLVIYLMLGFTGADMNLVSYILCHHPLGKIITLLVCITFFIEYDSRTAQSFFPTLCRWATPPPPLNWSQMDHRVWPIRGSLVVGIRLILAILLGALPPCKSTKSYIVLGNHTIWSTLPPSKTWIMILG